MLAISDAELDATICECGAWVGELEKHGNHVYSSGLQAVGNAVTIRTRNGKMSVTDGPFAETREFLAGFTIFEARDLNEAIQVASKMPANRLGSVEVRPLLTREAHSSDPIDLKVVAGLQRLEHG